MSATDATAGEGLLAGAGTEAAEGAADGLGETVAADVAAVEETPEQAETKARAARLALYEEKLTASREKRQAQRTIEKAKAERKAAAAERQAAAEHAAAEKAKYEGLKKAGSIKQTLELLGKNPREFIEEAQREAIEYSTPEAAAKRAQEALDAKFAEQQAKIDALVKEREDALAAEAARNEHQRLVTHFQKSLDDPAFKALRVEYPDEVLLDHAQHYAANPAELHQHARTYGVRLTDPHGRFTMHELLQVLSAAQAAHDAGKQARQAAQSPPEGQTGKPPTVNGTAERRNAGTVTNDLASQRASPGPKVSSGSVKDRLAASIEEEIRRYSGG